MEYFCVFGKTLCSRWFSYSSLKVVKGVGLGDL